VRRNLLEMALLFATFYLPGMLVQARALEHSGGIPGRFMVEALLTALPQLALFLYVLWLRERPEGAPRGETPLPESLPGPAPVGRRGASPWGRFGLGRFRARDLLTGVIIAGCALSLLVVVNAVLTLLPGGGRALLNEGFRFRLRDWRLIPLVLAFGVVTGYREELFFRGYLLTRFLDMRVPAAAALPASCLLFAMGHLYQGPAGFLTALALGILFGLLFLRNRNLHPLAVAHALYNTTVLIASLMLPGT
jgi:membrane protease YdiL (CAAX protease family)